MKWATSLALMFVLGFLVLGPQVAAAGVDDLIQIEEQIERDREGIRECHGILGEFDTSSFFIRIQVARATGDVEMVIHELAVAENANLAFEDCLVDTASHLIKTEKKYLAIKEEVLRDALQQHDIALVLSILKIEEEISLAKAELAQAWLRSSMFEEKLTLEKKKLFLSYLEGVEVK